MLILGFFGVGKTTCKNERVADLEELGPPSLSLLKSAVEKYDIVMANPLLAPYLIKSGIPFHVVVPSLDRKDEFIENFKRRYEAGTGGGDEWFCNLVGLNWDKWINHLLELPALSHIVLEKGEWLADAIEAIEKNFYKKNYC